MSFVTMTVPAQKTATKLSQFQQFKSNDDALNDALNRATAGIINGSFEVGSGSDAPIGWDRTTWGAAGYDTTNPIHGQQAYYFTSTGAGGGKLTSTDFIPCSGNIPVILSFLLRSSVADIRNIVKIKFYDKAQSAISDVTLYDDATTNPTSDTRFVRGCVPPATARYMKLELTFADSSDATAGTCTMDGIELISSNSVLTRDAIAEYAEASHSGTFTDRGNVSITIPGVANKNTFIRMKIQAYAKSTGSGNGLRFRIGSYYSNELTVDGIASYTPFVFEFPADVGANPIEGLSGTVTLYMQLKDGGSSCTAKVDAGGISYEILNA